MRKQEQVTLSIVDRLLSAQGFQHILCSNIPVKIRRTLKALETSGEKHVRAAISVLLHNNIFEDKLSQEEPEQIAALLKFIIKYEPVATAQLTARLLGSEAFILRSASSPQVHVASIVRFASRTSTEVVANFISSWWGHFSHRGERLNGKTLAGCGPMLRVANEFVPSVAIEMVEWLDAQGEYFIEEMREVPREIRLGLFNALTESGKTLSETKMRALGNNG